MIISNRNRMKLVRSEKGLRPATSRQVLTYEKEEQSQRKAVSDMKAGGAEAYDVKKKQELLDETLTVLSSGKKKNVGALTLS